MGNLVDFFRHPDVWLRDAFTHYGPQLYGLVFAIIFAETGLVFLPFLPGDSLLFALGALSAGDGPLQAGILYPLLFCAALLGDNVNYWVGRNLGRQLFSKPNSKIFKQSNLVRTEEFFARHGGKAIIMARFVPIVRTFAPFVAGMSRMPYAKFLSFSVAGAVLWVGLCVTAGRLFGGMEFVKRNFEYVVIAIVLVSILPMAIEFINHRRKATGETKG